MNITNGTVEYEHPHKVADFQIPKAKVTLSFVIPEGEDAAAALAIVGDMAKHRAMVMSGAIVEEAREEAPARPTARVRKTPPAAAPVTSAPGADGSNGAAGEKDGAGLTAASTASPSEGAKADPFGGATAASDTSAAVPNGSTPSPAATLADPRLTDKGIQDATTAKIAATPQEKKQEMIVAVKKLRAEFTGSPEIPMATVTNPGKRAAYLAALDALTV